jgi:DNA-binding HxlR family transcriptional regulator
MNHKTHSQSPEDIGECPVARAASLVGDMWTILIVRDLMIGPKRFGQLLDSLGSVSPKTLSHRLKMLETADLLTRHAYAEIPPRVEYSLTERGQALSHIVEAIRTFGEQYLTEPVKIDAPVCDEELIAEL